MGTRDIPKYLQLEEALAEECKELISTLPTQKGWFDSSYFYQHQGFWFQPDHLQAVISCQKNFQVQDSDIALVTFPKCGTTWLKAIIFTLLNRKLHPADSENHPLRSTNPHDLVLSLEINLYADNKIPNPNPNPTPLPSRRFFSTHMPYVALPKSLTEKGKIVYVCRNPKDTFVSLWHFMNKLRLPEDGDLEMEEVFEMFCEGAVGYGPFWDHVLEYWEKSRESPERVLFVKYEDMKEEGAVELRCIAEFLGCGFSEEEEEEGVVEKIVELCSFESMRNMEVNRSGRLGLGMENKHFFRKGVIGGWKECLSGEMVERLDRIMEEKLFGSGLVL